MWLVEIALVWASVPCLALLVVWSSRLDMSVGLVNGLNVLLVGFHPLPHI